MKRYKSYLMYDRSTYKLFGVVPLFYLKYKTIIKQLSERADKNNLLFPPALVYHFNENLYNSNTPILF